MADTPEAIKKSVRTYLIVFLALIVGTILTVLVAEWSVLDFGKHGFDTVDCVIGLTIATIKATLVAAIFMHLNHEKKAVYWLFGSGLCMVCSLAFLTALAMKDPIHDNLFYGKESMTPKMLASPTHR
ncbi:MAG: cytochrome C oxidase subunit IV family protein [Luteolibacter sp.]|uniref:cytochrome C oxidase subunit IV family protein n=1 Tax=Luteolibacter sp. TaxID=1962973 RepID=UPI00326425D1